MTVVFDSGVIISALHFEGTPLDALRAAAIHTSIAHCLEIDDEVRKALRGRKFKWTPSEVDEALRDFAEFTRLIKVFGDLRGICRDPKDDMVLECALLAEADFIVSGDRDLLILGQYAGIRIVTPRVFLTLMS